MNTMNLVTLNKTNKVKKFFLIVVLAVFSLIISSLEVSPLAKRIQAGEYIDSTSFYWIDSKERIKFTDSGWSRVPKKYRDYVYLSKEEAETALKNSTKSIEKPKKELTKKSKKKSTNSKKSKEPSERKVSLLAKRIKAGESIDSSTFYWIDSKGKIKSTDRGWSRVPKKERNYVYLSKSEAIKGLNATTGSQKEDIEWSSRVDLSSGQLPDQKKSINSEDKFRVQTSGFGITKSEATIDAQRNALKLSYQTFISSDLTVLNDQLVSQEIVSLVSGTIDDFQILSSFQDNEGYWEVSINAILSKGGLTQFSKSIGDKVNVQGSLFGAEIQQQNLNKINERNAINHLIKKIQFFDDFFNPELTIERPRYINDNSSLIRIVMTLKANETFDEMYKIVFDTLQAVKMDYEELEKYMEFKRPFYGVELCKDSRIFQNRNSDLMKKSDLERSWIKSFNDNASMRDTCTKEKVYLRHIGSLLMLANIEDIVTENLNRHFLRRVTEENEVNFGRLGINVRELTQKDKSLRGSKVAGVIVDRLDTNSPAEIGGLAKGDLILSINGVNVTNIDSFVGLIRQTTEGSKVSISILRGKSPKTIGVTLGSWTEAQKTIYFSQGVTLQASSAVASKSERTSEWNKFREDGMSRIFLNYGNFVDEYEDYRCYEYDGCKEYKSIGKRPAHSLPNCSTWVNNRALEDQRRSSISPPNILYMNTCNYDGKLPLFRKVIVGKECRIEDKIKFYWGQEPYESKPRNPAIKSCSFPIYDLKPNKWLMGLNFPRKNDTLAFRLFVDYLTPQEIGDLKSYITVPGSYYKETFSYNSKFYEEENQPFINPD